MARHDARCVGTVAADSAALIWDASAPFFMFDRPFLVTPRWTLFCWRECYLADKTGQVVILQTRRVARATHTVTPPR